MGGTADPLRIHTQVWSALFWMRPVKGGPATPHYTLHSVHTSFCEKKEDETSRKERLGYSKITVPPPKPPLQSLRGANVIADKGRSILI